MVIINLIAARKIHRVLIPKGQMHKTTPTRSLQEVKIGQELERIGSNTDLNYPTLYKTSWSKNQMTSSPKRKAPKQR